VAEDEVLLLVALRTYVDGWNAFGIKLERELTFMPPLVQFSGHSQAIDKAQLHGSECQNDTGCANFLPLKRPLRFDKTGLIC
jgi:hypothetical protein